MSIETGMQALNALSARGGSLLDAYSARLAEGLAVRRAAKSARAAREEADRAIRSRSEFFAGMNHELRTPLNAIIGFSTMLRDEDVYALSPAQRKSYAEYVLQSADLLLAHINTIIAVAALEAKSVKPDCAPFDAVEALDQAIERLGVAAAAAEVGFDRRNAATPASAFGDAQRFGQALDHVLRAAVAATPKGGRVMTRVAASPTGAEIAVRDFGAGLDAGDVEALLQLFDTTRGGADASLAVPGLGLAIARTLVELQGGAFAIESRKGKGTIIRLGLPFAEGIDAPIGALAS